MKFRDNFKSAQGFRLNAVQIGRRGKGEVSLGIAGKLRTCTKNMRFERVFSSIHFVNFLSAISLYFGYERVMVNNIGRQNDATS